MLHALLDQSIFNDGAKTKLAMLAFLYCGEFVKNSIESVHNKNPGSTFVVDLVPTMS